MLRVSRQEKKLTSLERKSLPQAGIKERGDLQQMIRSSPKAFFAEMGEDLLLLNEEVRPTVEVVDDRIDLLAVDKEGATVIIELKRDSHKLQLLQALAYAGMVSKWPQERLAQERAKLMTIPEREAGEQIEEFIAESVAELNQVQRIVLLAEDFEYEVLVTAEWLTEQYGVDIRCYRLALAVDGTSEYLSCTCIYPPPELAKAAIRRGRIGRGGGEGWKDWDSALADIQNPDVVTFFRAEVERRQEQYLPTRSVIYRFGGKRRLFVEVRNKFAYVWQEGRFTDDEAFWKKTLGDDADVEPVNSGASLRFYLKNSGQFAEFPKAVAGHVTKVQFTGAGGDGLPTEAQ